MLIVTHLLGTSEPLAMRPTCIGPPRTLRHSPSVASCWVSLLLPSPQQLGGGSQEGHKRQPQIVAFCCRGANVGEDTLQSGRVTDSQEAAIRDPLAMLITILLVITRTIRGEGEGYRPQVGAHSPSVAPPPPYLGGEGAARTYSVQVSLRYPDPPSPQPNPFLWP